MSTQTYRDYYHIKRGDEGFDEDSKTNFLKSGENEYTLHHAYGKAGYKYYEEYTKEVEDTVQDTSDTWEVDGMTFIEDIPF